MQQMQEDEYGDEESQNSEKILRQAQA